MASLLKNFIHGNDTRVINKVPPPIFQSWKRCRGLNVNHEQLFQDDILQSNRLNELLDSSELLIRTAKPILQHIFSLLHTGKYQIMLSNNDGYILETLGDPSFVNKTEKFFLTPGVNWRENLKGTNGIGTVLIEQTPLAIPGWTHYSLPVSFLDCWASPISSSDGNLIGVLNISGEAGATHKHVMEITTLGAAMIEQSLAIAEMQARFNLSKRDLDALGKTFINSLVPVDKGDSIKTDQQNFFVPISFNQTAGCETQWRGRSPKTHSILDIAMRATRTDSTVLIQGESGTGKEIIARTIHNSSTRKEKPFVTLNCAAIPPNLVESELFGYTGGAFTGAKQSGQPGKFELASSGTIFLDEIGDMPFPVQASLLRVLQQKEVYRIGDNKRRVMDARVIAATNQDLCQMVNQGKFRLDLYYRLKVIFIEIPPLRERIEDIWDLAPYFVEKLCKKFGLPRMDISPELFHHLVNNQWPGNVRQLENCIENMIALSTGTSTLTIANLPIEYTTKFQCSIPSFEDQISHQSAQLEKKLIIQALKDVNGNIAAAARKLGIGRTTLYRKMNKLDIVFP
ncbi:Acetoin dehydrogenase operon transcriptional activator AcoR [Sporomusa silvacetica DSM 10669]|uniref:Acetoin dehydrogenase operon transcriptional activator AcoR n=1 Tax=Sporomusa silvacetica DSM 10669 TaxID=1123289 RepID=A0ABZ3IHK4_9FIRM|nr:sigma-54-dependent Fis family transcriptional regulator [Sporomusa silvacetica]OZC17433.1 acetoin dehydrogenase operon transcriptional activator AcoR [Sporomusa silvacetica DSM 10669]